MPICCRFDCIDFTALVVLTLISWIGRFIIPELKIVTHTPHEAKGAKEGSDKAEAFQKLFGYRRNEKGRRVSSSKDSKARSLSS